MLFNERNSITTNIFSEYVNDTHQDDDKHVDLTEMSKDVLIIKLDFFIGMMNNSVNHLNLNYIINVEM